MVTARESPEQEVLCRGRPSCNRPHVLKSEGVGCKAQTSEVNYEYILIGSPSIRFLISYN
jgi:hypothetical protein